MKFKFLFLVSFLLIFSFGFILNKPINKYLEKFNNRYSLDKVIKSENDLSFDDADANRIDTTFLLNYKLVDPNFGKDSPYFEFTRIKHLNGYRCEHVGHYKTKNGILLFSKSMRSIAGNGNPTLMLSSIDNNGNLLDFIRFEWEFEQDVGLQDEIIFSISSDFKIKHDKLRTYYKIDDDKRIPIKTTTVTKKFELLFDGHFKAIKEMR